MFNIHYYLLFKLSLCCLGLRNAPGGDSEHYKTLLGASNGPVQAENEFLSWRPALTSGLLVCRNVTFSIWRSTKKETYNCIYLGQKLKFLYG